MTLKELIHIKNLTNTRVAEILGVSRDIVQNYLSGKTPMPPDVLEKIQYEPMNETAHITRGELLALMARLRLTFDDVAAALSKHHDRAEKWCDPARPHAQRVPITPADVRRIEQSCL